MRRSVSAGTTSKRSPTATSTTASVMSTPPEPLTTVRAVGRRVVPDGNRPAGPLASAYRIAPLILYLGDVLVGEGDEILPADTELVDAALFVHRGQQL